MTNHPGTSNHEDRGDGDLADKLARHVARARYADLPEATIEITKKFILDTLGTSLAGTTAPGCEAVTRLICEDGSAPQSLVWLGGKRVPASNAAFVNSMLAHAIEFDDTRDALGICYSQAAGNRQCNIDRAMVKRMQIGFAARAGVQSCDFVDAGITGARGVFDGAVGMAKLYFNGKFDNARTLHDLGKHWLGTDLSIKHGCRGDRAARAVPRG